MKPHAVIPVGAASPVAYENVYEEGDRWDKVRGCSGCERPAGSCCGNCPQLVDNLCGLELRDPDLKPLNCIVKPLPNQCLKGCQLAFRCSRGTRMGKFRYVTDIRDRFREEGYEG